MNVFKHDTISTQVADNYSAISNKNQSLNILQSMQSLNDTNGWIMVISDKAVISKEMCKSNNIDVNRVISFSKKHTSDVFLTAQQALLSNNCAALYICQDLLPIDQLEFLFSMSENQKVHLGLFESKLHAH